MALFHRSHGDRMQIGIDLLPLQSDPKRRGISNFAYNTIKELLALDQSNEYTFFNAKDVNIDFIKECSQSVQIVKDEITPKRSANLDLFIYTSFFDFEKKIVDPSSLKCKVVIIVYDIIPIILWDYYIKFFPQEIKCEYFKRIALIRECDKILTISQAVKKDLIEILEMPENSIDVIYAGIDNKNERVDDDIQKVTDLKEKYHIKGKYIFSVPSMDVRKNIFGLIEAYGLLPLSIKDEFQIVISNELTTDYENKYREHARKWKIYDQELIFTNYVSKEELTLLYKNSSLFVFPTLYEGFGLPVLEAMHHGIPVITSNLSSLPEVVEDAGVLVNPYNTQEIANEMINILTSTDLQTELSEKGITQSKKFNWAHTAQLTLDACESYNKKSHFLRLGMITPWNTKCGVAEYSKYLIENLPDVRISIFTNHEHLLVDTDGLNVIRCWESPLCQFDTLFSEIIKKNIDIIHFQFNFGLFQLSNLIQLKNKLQKMGVKVILTFHGTVGPKEIRLENYSSDLQTFDSIIVHTEGDLKRMSDIGVKENVALIPQGIKTIRNHKTLQNKEYLKFRKFPIIATFGFCLPHKGILETIQAISLLKKEYNNILFLVLSALYPVNESQAYFERCQKEVNDLDLIENVLFFPDFIDEKRVYDLLQTSDIIVMPYTETKESSSGAVKFTFSTLKPIIVTDIPIFNEYQEEVFKIPQSSPEEISQGIRDILGDAELRKKIVKRMEDKMLSESWDAVAQQYKKLLLDIVEHHIIE